MKISPKLKKIIVRGVAFALVALGALIFVYVQTALHPWASISSYMVLTFPTVVIFILLGRHKIEKADLNVSKKEIILWIILSASLFILRSYLDFNVLRKFLTLAAVLSLFLAFFGLRFLWQMRREALVALLALLVLWHLNFFVVWDYLGRFVSNIVAYLFELGGHEASVRMMPVAKKGGEISPQIIVDGFAVLIVRGCAGIQSLSIYIIMFIAAMAIEIKRIRTNLVLPAFLLGLLGTLVIVILRIYTLIWIAIHGHPEFAVTALHNTLGMVLFIVFFSVFLIIAFKWMRKRGPNEALPTKGTKP